MQFWNHKQSSTKQKTLSALHPIASFLQIGIILALERPMPPMNHAVTLVHERIPHLHGDIVSFSIVVGSIDHRARHQGHLIHVQCQYRSGGVLSNSLERSLGQFLLGPFLQHGLSRAPRSNRPISLRPPLIWNRTHPALPSVPPSDLRRYSPQTTHLPPLCPYCPSSIWSASWPSEEGAWPAGIPCWCSSTYWWVDGRSFWCGWLRSHRIWNEEWPLLCCGELNIPPRRHPKIAVGPDKKPIWERLMSDGGKDARRSFGWGSLWWGRRGFRWMNGGG